MIPEYNIMLYTICTILYCTQYLHSHISAKTVLTTVSILIPWSARRRGRGNNFSGRKPWNIRRRRTECVKWKHVFASRMHGARYFYFCTTLRGENKTETVQVRVLTETKLDTFIQLFSLPLLSLVRALDWAASWISWDLTDSVLPVSLHHV